MTRTTRKFAATTEASAPSTVQHKSPGVCMSVAGATTGAIVGGAVGGLVGAAFGGIAGFLIGFSSAEDERRNQGW